MVYRQKTPSPKKLAIVASERYYFTGKPCKSGHIAKRWTHNSVCTQCCAENFERWRKLNKDRVAQNAKKWRASNPEKEKANRKRANSKWRAQPKNQEKARLLSKIRYERDGDEIRRKQRERNLKDKIKRAVYNKEWRTKNAEHMREKAKKWAAANPEKVRESKRNAKAKRKNVPGKHTAQDIKSILKLQKNKCAYCKDRVGEKYHIDHIIPVSKGGTNDRKNLQITCADCNLAKGARDPIVHAQSLGMLL